MLGVPTITRLESAIPVKMLKPHLIYATAFQAANAVLQAEVATLNTKLAAAKFEANQSTNLSAFQAGDTLEVRRL